MLITSIIVIVASLGVALVGAVVVGKRVTTPIKELTNAANEIKKGNLDIEITTKGKDEIGELSDAFKQMIASIKMITKE